MTTKLQTTSAAESSRHARAGAAVLRRKCACGQHTIGGGDCESCARKAETLRRRAANDADGAREKTGAHESVRRALDSAGQPLDGATRAFFESRFGHDFSGVRVHTGANAQESARAVNALAYTVGRDVVFGSGQYAPQTEEGRRLIAHELTHTLQQSSQPSSASALQRDSLTVAPADDAGEREAEQNASHVEAATPARMPSAARPHLQRRLLQRQPKPAPTKGGRAPKLPLCPSVGTSDSTDDMRQAACTVSKIPPAGTPPDCIFSPKQEGLVRASQKDAAERVRRAELVATKLPDEAAELAKKLFDDEVSAERVREVMGRVRPFLTGDKIKYQGRNCADKECRVGATVAYVSAPGTLPIYICPGSFRYPKRLYEIILHESLHWAGVASASGEAYCTGEPDCDTGCGPSDLADAWMHYVGCLGKPYTPRTRKDFNEKITDSVREIE